VRSWFDGAIENEYTTSNTLSRKIATWGDEGGGGNIGEGDHRLGKSKKAQKGRGVIGASVPQELWHR